MVFLERCAVNMCISFTDWVHKVKLVYLVYCYFCANSVHLRFVFPCALSLSLGSVCYLVISFHYVRCGKCVTCVLSTRYFVRPLRTLCSVILFIKFSGFTSFILFNIYSVHYILGLLIYSVQHLFSVYFIHSVHYPICVIVFILLMTYLVFTLFNTSLKLFVPIIFLVVITLTALITCIMIFT